MTPLPNAAGHPYSGKGPALHNAAGHPYSGKGPALHNAAGHPYSGKGPALHNAAGHPYSGKGPALHNAAGHPYSGKGPALHNEPLPTSTLNRREMLSRSAVALGLSAFPLGWTAAADAPKKKILMYTRSVGFEHGVVRRTGGKLSLAETIVTDLGGKHGFEVVCEKDGRVFLSKEFPKFDGFVFETQGDLTAEKCKDGSPPMPAEGKKALLEAVAGGKGFVGCHCASDTFHSAGEKFKTQERDKLDPYIAMIGGEFIKHGRQQKAWMRVADGKFPGLKDVKDFELMEEWYALKNFAPDLHVILVQETKGMVDAEYQRPNFPATWARLHDKGRVFYTSMGHRDDVWKNATFQQLLLGGLSWSLGLVKADVAPNMKEATPKGSELPEKK